METKFAKFLRKVTEYLTYLFIFILPWQVKLILRPGETNYSEISLQLCFIILIIILILFFWLRLKENDYETGCKYTVYSLAAFGFFAFISIFFAPDKLLAFYRYFILLTGISLFFVIRLGVEPRTYKDVLFDKTYLIYSFLLSIFFQASLGIYQFLTQSSFAFKYLGLAAHNPDTLGTAVVETATGRWLRAYGGMDHPNILGGTLAITLIFVAYLLAKKKMLNTSKQTWESILLFVFYFVALYALFFTFSRTAWIALVVGLVALLFAFIFNKDKWILNRFIALLFFSIILVGIVAAPFQDLLMVRVDAQTRLEQKSINERLGYIDQAKNLLEKNLLTGVGIGNYSAAASEADNNKKAAWDYQPVHNVFLLILTEGGIFSLLSFLAFLFFLMKNGRRELYAWAIMMPLLVIMMLDHWLFSLPYGVFFFFLLLGLI
jgi:O-antigen ligase